MALQEEFEQQGVWLFKYRGTLPVLILFIGLGIYVYAALNPELFLIQDPAIKNYFLIFCIVVSLFGQYIRAYTVGHTPKNTSGRNTGEQIADTLNTTGIYSTVRHPLYVGNFFMWLGPALVTENIWFIVAFILFYWVYYERIMFAEEQFLRRKFKEVYTSWAERTPAFIPSFKNFVKPNLSFSWKKVLKKEKNGFAAIFIIFCAFDVIAELLKGTQEFNIYLIIAAVISVVLYLILKALKNTSLMQEEGR
ncbi:isoprenylcysteine carboxylmethyltransferase family protein [Marivirga salinae]|uniref:Isoprenylcysteine carboxylmethyltransferase family protein n=1 Tax=Marivirga salinarum TaxID=3059078 RepID=A0AA51RBR1_9BACT|nr:isoprenylcysteine carboxylmethyltransferase family protein [Marivirga sp. BDSF4-3]WMN10773.1 isoprenylcysteine carboxylmethyltransferase family protein [Marivirga sp. BDSF4-3]